MEENKENVNEEQVGQSSNAETSTNVNNENNSNNSKEDLKSLYMSKLKISKDQWQIINNLCDKRNSNPLCHANCNIFTNKKDLSSVILKDINGINNLISEIIDIYI